MANTIRIKYTAPVAPNVAAVTPICRYFFPAGCAADHPSMEGTYYDTNVQGWGEATALDQFMSQMVAHPGLVAAVKQAVANGEYTMEEVNEAVKLYICEVAPALADQGFTFEVNGVVLGAEGEAGGQGNL